MRNQNDLSTYRRVRKDCEGMGQPVKTYNYHYAPPPTFGGVPAHASVSGYQPPPNCAYCHPSSRVEGLMDAGTQRLCLINGIIPLVRPETGIDRRLRTPPMGPGRVDRGGVRRSRCLMSMRNVSWRKLGDDWAEVKQVGPVHSIRCRIGRLVRCGSRSKRSHRWRCYRVRFSLHTALVS